ncbi:sel1 repeat family protein [Halomonas sp. ANAO-440]|nr:sel1 repeat family protein [Halomonas sp. ANAO-440]
MHSEDYATAARHLPVAAEQGDALAQFWMGWMYRNGKGMERDFEQAAQWYRRSAEQGNAAALNNLGHLHDQGHGVAQDRVLAYALYNLAASRGNEKGLSNRDQILSELTPAQVAQGQRMAAEWREGPRSAYEGRPGQVRPDPKQCWIDGPIWYCRRSGEETLNHQVYCSTAAHEKRATGRGGSGSPDDGRHCTIPALQGCHLRACCKLDILWRNAPGPWGTSTMEAPRTWTCRLVRG